MTRHAKKLAVMALCGFSMLAHAQTPDLGQIKDLEQMARQVMTGQVNVAGESASNVMLFVSLSMPAPVLKELAAQAADAGIPMVLRGFAKAPGQLEAVNPGLTTERINEVLTSGLVGTTKSPSWSVDPESFKTFGIDRVPALVVAHQRLPGPSCQRDAMAGAPIANLEKSCASQWEAAVIFGDASLHESLRRATQSPHPEVVQLAQSALARLRGQEVPRATNLPKATVTPDIKPQPAIQRNAGEIRIR